MNHDPLQHEGDSLDALDALVAGIIDRDGNDARRAELLERLQADPAARDQYVQLIQLTTMLEWAHLEVESESLPVLEPAGPRFRWPAVAAALIALATVSIIMLWPGGPEPLATITALDSAAWRGGQPPNVGQVLPQGSFEMTAGRAELTTAAGVVIDLHGPAKFRIDSASAMHLQFGRAELEVPPAGVGYTITTPMARCIDLGTRFEVHVDRRGQTDVQVIEGRVQVARADAAGGQAPVILRSGESAKVDRLGVVHLPPASQPDRTEPRALSRPTVSGPNLIAASPWYLRDASVTIHSSPSGDRTLEFTAGGIGIAEKVLDVTHRHGQPLVVTAAARYDIADPLSPQQYLHLRVRFFDSMNRELPGRVDAPVVESSDPAGELRQVEHHVIVPDGAATIRVALMYKDDGLSTGRILDAQTAVHLERE